jgi:hypothetical protein
MFQPRGTPRNAKESAFKAQMHLARHVDGIGVHSWNYRLSGAPLKWPVAAPGCAEYLSGFSALTENHHAADGQELV